MIAIKIKQKTSIISKLVNTKDVKDVINDYLATGNGKEGSSMGVEKLSL